MYKTAAAVAAAAAAARFLREAAAAMAAAIATPFLAASFFYTVAQAPRVIVSHITAASFPLSPSSADDGKCFI